MSNQEPELVVLLKDQKTGSQWTSGLTWQALQNKLSGLREETQALRDEIFKLKQRLWILETPQRYEEILRFIGGKWRDEQFIERGTNCSRGDLHEMVRAGKLSTQKQGTHIMYAKPQTVKHLSEAELHV